MTPNKMTPNRMTLNRMTLNRMMNNKLSSAMSSVLKCQPAECNYALCRSAKCRGACLPTQTRVTFLQQSNPFLKSAKCSLNSRMRASWPRWLAGQVGGRPPFDLFICSFEQNVLFLLELRPNVINPYDFNLQRGIL